MSGVSLDQKSTAGEPTEALPQLRQLTLRGLFLCMTYFAIASALAAALGVGIFVLMNGVLLTWLSYRGYLWWMQTIRARPRVYGLAWFLFAVSFALPVLTVKGCGNGLPQTHYGWQAALATCEGFLRLCQNASEQVTRETPVSVEEIGELLSGAATVVAFNLPNLLMLVSPWLLWQQQRGQGQLLSTLFGCAAISTWSWGIFAGQDLRIGYYVWTSGVTAIFLARPPGWRSLLTMGLFGAAWLALAFIA